MNQGQREGVVVTQFHGVGTPGTHCGMPVVGSSGGRRLASIIPAASHEKEELLGTVEGGEGWSAAVITDNGTVVEQGIGGGENFKSMQPPQTWWTR
jgi:hypothetical protein